MSLGSSLALPDKAGAKVCVFRGVSQGGSWYPHFPKPILFKAQGHLSQYSLSSGACFSIAASVSFFLGLLSFPRMWLVLSTLSVQLCLSLSSVPMAQGRYLPHRVAWWPLTVQAGDYVAAGGGRLLIPFD